jgi:hypothetical protein
MEIILEIVGSFVMFIVTEIVLAGLGWLCLFVRYRNRKKMEEIKNKKYAGEYSAVGHIMILDLIAGLGATALFGMLVALLGLWLYKAVVA